MIQIYWGDGKGKTTAALGTALRASGHNMKVHLVQFMKDKTGNPEFDVPGEIKSLENLPNLTFKRFGTGKWIGKPTQEHIEKVNEATKNFKGLKS